MKSYMFLAAFVTNTYKYLKFKVLIERDFYLPLIVLSWRVQSVQLGIITLHTSIHNFDFTCLSAYSFSELSYNSGLSCTVLIKFSIQSFSASISKLNKNPTSLWRCIQMVKRSLPDWGRSRPTVGSYCDRCNRIIALHHTASRSTIPLRKSCCMLQTFQSGSFWVACVRAHPFGLYIFV